jgi:outer membrane receptor protein involved in Fe transport
MQAISREATLAKFKRVTHLASLSILAAVQSAMGQQADAPPPAPAPTAAPADAPAAGQRVDELDTIVVNGIRRGDLILPTTVTSTSAFGLDIGVMDTPRNNTLLSHAQIDALNVQNPQGFSYLTSSSYTDASFGVPNVPRIRGQYGDMFFNGMRDSFTSNGYGAPITFNSVDTLDIIKGPASVQAGPGQGVGGAIDITTKLPNPARFTGSVYGEVDTLHKRRWNVDVGGPVSDNLSYRVSYSGDYSGSYYSGMYFHQEALYGVVVAHPTAKYSVQFNSEYTDTRYRENDGINRASQQLIDSGAYLTGSPAPGTLSGFFTPVILGNPTQLNGNTIIDEAPGTGSRSSRYNAQLIQTYDVNDSVTVVNNTFYNYLNRYNIVQYYFVDTSKASFTIENKTDVKVKFTTPLSGLTLNHAVDAGISLRYAHVQDLQNFANEPVGVWDLSGNPNSWVFPYSLQFGGTVVPVAFGAQEYVLPGRTPFFYNATINSNLTDFAAFVEHRIEVSPTLSVMYGLRGDAVHLIESDPLGGTDYLNGFPSATSTPWYGLGNGNISPVYHPTSWMSTYLTYNFAQYVNPNSNDGGVGTYNVNPANTLRQNTRLVEAGAKFDLLEKSLFASTALFSQSRSVPAGAGNLQSAFAHIKGFEAELNYQPNPRLFATASYSYLHTELDTPSGFYNFPAHVGLNVDGIGNAAVFAPGQSFKDPGIPEHLFNFLVNYKDPSGFGAQGNLQVTGPIDTTTSGLIDVQATLANLQQNYGYTATSMQPLVGNSTQSTGLYHYQAPTIPWQYTLNLAGTYDTKGYTFKLAIYNVTDRRNWTNDYPYYGNDFITRNPPRSFDLSVRYRFN